MASATEFEIVCDGAAGAVRLAPEVCSVFRKAIAGNDRLPRQRKAHLKRYFEEFCRNIQHNLSQEKYKKEGNFPDGKGGEVGIWAFKAFQLRIYGSVLGVASKRTFVGVKIDVSKKQDRADQELLRSAAYAIADLFEYSA